MDLIVWVWLLCGIIFGFVPGAVLRARFALDAYLRQGVIGRARLWLNLRQAAFALLGMLVVLVTAWIGRKLAGVDPDGLGFNGLVVGALGGAILGWRSFPNCSKSAP